jgi:hypothetical protein
MSAAISDPVAVKFHPMRDNIHSASADREGYYAGNHDSRYRAEATEPRQRCGCWARVADT